MAVAPQWTRYVYALVELEQIRQQGAVEWRLEGKAVQLSKGYLLNVHVNNHLYTSFRSDFWPKPPDRRTRIKWA